jgi:hypothetical protein
MKNKKVVANIVNPSEIFYTFTPTYSIDYLLLIKSQDALKCTTIVGLKLAAIQVQASQLILSSGCLV